MFNKFYLKSLGCKQNQFEGQIIQNELINNGFISVDNIIEADYYILNSCTVTSHSDSEANYLINQAKKINPKIKTILTGCIAQTYLEHDDFNYKNIDLIIGNNEKLNIADYILKQGFFVKDIFSIKEFENKFLLNPNTTRLSIKIQDGCNNRCSYCIIPFARGLSRSNSIENIIKQINIAIENNIKEIVLTGIHISQWGLDINKKFIDLLNEIEKTKIQRLRLGSLYVNELDDEVIEFLSKSKKFCPHFHLSLQSLCDKTLKNMNRFYNSNEALELIKKLNNKFINPFIGCDIIVGFPYETDEDFNITYNNLLNSKLSKIHCFPYSRRKNTAAYSMPKIKDEIKTKRAKKIMELDKKLHREFLERNKNTEAEILIEKKNPKTGFYTATTRNYIKIRFKDENNNLRHTIKTVNLGDFELI